MLKQRPEKVIDHRPEKVGRGLRPRRRATISKNLHFPCRFLPSRWKYTVEDMEDSIYKKYGIDPNRIPTDAEVELVAYCFDVSLEEARSILLSHKSCPTENEDTYTYKELQS